VRTWLVIRITEFFAIGWVHKRSVLSYVCNSNSACCWTQGAKGKREGIPLNLIEAIYSLNRDTDIWMQHR
jgi:hypothetical protein